jgi:hypothetical protein
VEPAGVTWRHACGRRPGARRCGRTQWEVRGAPPLSRPPPRVILRSAASPSSSVNASRQSPGIPNISPSALRRCCVASFTIDQHTQWTRALQQHGYKPGFYHLDVAVNYLEVHAREFNFSDMRALQFFFTAQGIPFGIIFWSGHDPEPTGASYYNHVVNWVERVHAAIGAPEQSIIQSWVPRSSIKCTAGVRCDKANNWMCSPADPPYCGKLSVPNNLPENNPFVFSHTRLINTVTEILRGR